MNNLESVSSSITTGDDMYHQNVRSWKDRHLATSCIFRLSAKKSFLSHTKNQKILCQKFIVSLGQPSSKSQKKSDPIPTTSLDFY